MELNSLAQKSCALVAASTTSDEWLGLLNTHVVPTIVHLDPDPATDDGTWLKQTVVYAADAACEADLFAGARHGRSGPCSARAPAPHAGQYRPRHPGRVPDLRHRCRPRRRPGGPRGRHA